MGGRNLARFFTSLLRWWGIFKWRCSAGLPWFWPARPPGHDAMVEARRITRWYFGRDHGPMCRKLAQVFVTVAYPLAVLLNLWDARGWPGRGASKRVPGALWAAFRHNIMPSEYYAYGLWQPDRKVNVDNYLYANECARLFKVLNRPPRPDPIDDKVAFHEMCRAHALPTPAILAIFAPACTLMAFGSGEPPKHDLFVKASTGHSRAERLRWRGIHFESNRGCLLRPEDLPNYLAGRARSENLTLLVQPVLSNHPVLRLPSDGPLAAARFVTGRSINGEVTAIYCVMYWGRAGELTSHGNWVSMIDVASGRIMPAPPQDAPCVSLYQYRPSCNDTCTLPSWDAALQYVKIAHQACASFVFVGWDVAFTPHGPVILEGNANWEAATYQTLRGEPLGHTKFVDILAERLQDSGKGPRMLEMVKTRS